MNHERKPHALPFLIIAALGLWLGAAFPAAAAHSGGRPFCAPRAEITEQLSTKYGETLRAYRMFDATRAEFWGDLDDGSWTLMTMPNATTACLRDAGWDWTGDIPEGWTRVGEPAPIGDPA